MAGRKVSNLLLLLLLSIAVTRTGAIAADPVVEGNGELEPASQETIFVRAIHLSGTQTAGNAELQAVIADMLGQRLTLDQLAALAGRIQHVYRERGFSLARAYVPAQTVRDGVVEIAVVLGRYGAVELNNTSRLHSAVARRILYAQTKGALIRQQSLDRALLLLSDLPGVEVQSVLAPGDDLGTADLTVDLADTQLISGQWTLDSSGNETTGGLQTGLNAQVDDPFGLGDRLTLGGSVSAGQTSAQLSYSLLVGQAPYRLGASIAGMRYTLGGDFAGLDAHGSAATQRLFLHYPLRRAAGYTLSLETELAHRSSVETMWTESTRKSSTALTLGVAGEHLGSTADLQYKLDLTQGNLNIATPAARLADAQSANTQGPFTKATADVLYSHPLSPKSSIAALLRGQVAFNNLDDVERFSLGGPSGVRAYPSNVATGDSGWLAGLTLRHAPDWLARLPGDWVVESFIDAGGVNTHTDPWIGADDGGRTLAGAGVGLVWSRTGGAAARFELACPLGPAPATATVARPCRLWSHVGISFDV